jgi:hypothetical protein
MSTHSPPSGGPDDRRPPGDPKRSAKPAPTLVGLADAVLKLGKTVTALGADVEALQDRKAAGGPWWNTDALTPGDADRLHGTIVAFGDHLKTVYAITALPHRWERDPAVFAELAALYVGWIGAYREPRAGTSQPLQWHESLARSIDRIRTYQDRRRQRDSDNTRDPTDTPPLPVAFIPQPSRQHRPSA